MISLFDRELMRMEQEVRDLKTIHQRGLGTTRFYVYERQITIPSGIFWFYFDATVEDASLIPMAMLPFIEGPTTINYTITFTANGFEVGGIASEGTVVVRVFTSQPLATITTGTRTP